MLCPAHERRLELRQDPGDGLRFYSCRRVAVGLNLDVPASAGIDSLSFALVAQLLSKMAEQERLIAESGCEISQTRASRATISRRCKRVRPQRSRSCWRRTLQDTLSGANGPAWWPNT